MKRDGSVGSDEIEALNAALAGFKSLASNPTMIPGSVGSKKTRRAYSDAEVDALFC
jgi:hypothetical protein